MFPHLTGIDLTITEQRLLKQVNNLVYDLDRCTGCGICMDVCPEEAITSGQAGPLSKDGILYSEAMQVDEKKCSYCGVCVIMCPFDALKLDLSNLWS